MNDWFSALGFRETTLLGGLVGAILSLKFIPGKNLWQRGSNVAGGMLAAAYIAPFVVSFFSLNAKLEAGFAFLIGLYGMTIASALLEQITPTVQALREKFTR